MRRYVQEMKIDVRLFDLLLRCRMKAFRHRDEIVAFNIDTANSQISLITNCCAPAFGR